MTDAAPHRADIGALARLWICLFRPAFLRSPTGVHADHTVRWLPRDVTGASSHRLRPADQTPNGSTESALVHDRQGSCEPFDATPHSHDNLTRYAA
jgi:hypothetical protein